MKALYRFRIYGFSRDDWFEARTSATAVKRGKPALVATKKPAEHQREREARA